MDNFDFDEWARLYRDDPAEYERRRADVINKTIMDTPIGQRNELRMIQLEVDTIRKIYPDPLEATSKIAELLVEKLKRMRAEMTRLRETLEDTNEDKS